MHKSFCYDEYRELIFKTNYDNLFFFIKYDNF